MAPLELRMYNPFTKEWKKVGEVPEGDNGSISNNKPDGTRDIYFFECAEDNSHSTIYRSGFGMDMEITGTSLRELIIDGSKIEKVAELKADESHEMIVKTDKGSMPVNTRFTHKS